MKIVRQLFVFLMIITPLLTMTSCGSDDDDSNVTVQTEEPSPTPTPDDDGTSTCLSSTRRETIRTFLNRLASLTTAQGTAFRNGRTPDGTVWDFQGDGGYTLTENTESSWSAQGTFCDATGFCIESNWQGEIRDDGCFYSEGDRAKVISATSSRLTYTTLSGGTTTQSTVSIDSSDKLRVNETLSREGETILIFKFEPF